MAIFGDDGQAVVDSLSDEAIYGSNEEVTEATAEERQESETPHEEAEVIEEHDGKPSPGDSQTSNAGDGEETPAVNAGQADISIEEQLRQLREANERIQKSYDNLRSWTSRVDGKNKQLEEQNSLLQQQLQQFKSVPANEEARRRDNLRDLINEPERVIAQQVRRELEPIFREREENKQRQDFDLAVKECAKQWPQFQDTNNQKRVIEEMVSMSREKGLDPMAWRSNSKDYMILACHRLFGVPRVVDPAALEAAKKAGREEALREIENRKNKNGLTVVPNANNDPTDTAEQTPEDEIRAAMHKYSSHGIFG